MNARLLSSRWSQLPETVVCRLQAERLREYLRTTILPFSAHYRELFRARDLTADSLRSLDDLAQLPFTSKADLINTDKNPQRFKDFIIVPDKQILTRRPSTIFNALTRGRKFVERKFEAEFRPIFLTFTTGRAAQPVPFTYTQHDLANLSLVGHRMMEVCAAHHDDRLMNAFPYAPHLAFWLAHYASTAFGVTMLSSGGGKVMGTDGTLRLIRQLKPDTLIGIPTFLYHVLHQAVAEGMYCANLRRLVLGAEKVSNGLRRKLRDLCTELGANNVQVMATYGFTEAKQAWAECPFPPDQPSGGYHLYPDLGIVEIINPETGAVVPNGQPGEIVFTPLAARGSVVLRYRTGDCTDGGLTYEPCPHCGRTLPRLLGNISRRSEIREMHLDKIKGTLVDFNALEHVLDDAPHIGAWQLELRKLHDDPLELDELVLHVTKLNGANEDQLRHALSERCQAQLEIHPNRIVFHDEHEMQQLQGVGKLIKEQKLVDHRPTAAPTTPTQLEAKS
jgi:phenylacetate-CoA ligase